MNDDDDGDDAEPTISGQSHCNATVDTCCSAIFNCAFGFLCSECDDAHTFASGVVVAIIKHPPGTADDTKRHHPECVMICKHLRCGQRGKITREHEREKERKSHAYRHTAIIIIRSAAARLCSPFVVCVCMCG